MNHDNNPTDVLGSRIVGATIARDDIEHHYEQYPLLEEVAELGAELETVSDSALSEEVMSELLTKFHQLKSQLDSR